MKLIRYVVELDRLTLIFLQENGQELVVPISSKTIPEHIASDVMDLLYDGDGWTRPSITKITRTIDPDGTIRKSPQDVEFEVESKELSFEDFIKL